MQQSEQINELAAALSKAQAEITPAIKDSSNPFFKSKYADLSSVWSACRDPLTKNGLAVMQTMDFKDGQLVLATTLAHSSGQWMRSFLPILNEKGNAQGLGSAITYNRRYALSAIVGIICDEDDDANAACSQNHVTSSNLVEQVKDLLKKCNPKDVNAMQNYYLNQYDANAIDDLPDEGLKGFLASIQKHLRMKQQQFAGAA